MSADQGPYADDAPEPFQVPSQFHGLACYEVPIQGTDVTCYVGRWDKRDDWNYSLWTSDDECVGSNTITIPSDVLQVTAEQVARIAFLLECEYTSE